MEALLILLIAYVVAFMLQRHISYFQQRILVPDRYSWLDLLHHVNWKHEREIMGEMQRQTEIIRPLPIMFLDLKDLIEEGLVEAIEGLVIVGDKQVPTMYFRLTHKGLHKRYEINKKSAGTDPDGPWGPV